MLGKPQRTIFTLAVALALVATGCNASADKDKDSGAAGSGGSAKSFVLVTPEPIGVNEFLKLASQGAEQAATKNSGKSKVFQAKDTAAIPQQVTAAVREKPDVIAVVGFEFTDIIAQQAEQNPKQQFLFVDSCTKKAYPNVTCAVFREHEAVFLAGAEAGLLSKTKKVGAVVALDTPQFHRYSDPFAAGAKKVDPAVNSTTLFVGGQNPFNDPARAKEQASTLAGRKADYVMGAAAAGNFGIFEAAKKGAFKTFGVDANQCPVAPGAVVDNVLKRTDVAIKDGIDQILQGKGGNTVSLGLKEGGMSLTGLQDDVASSKCVIAEHAAVITKIKSLRDQIVGGQITVDDPAKS